jgi:peptidyl-tRNA hydrolase
MTAGKAASQAGHAFLSAYIAAPPDVRDAYHDADGDSTKITLSARTEHELRQAYDAARAAGIPCSIVVEGIPDHALPVPTAVGIGPVERATAKPITRRFSLMK